MTINLQLEIPGLATENMYVASGLFTYCIAQQGKAPKLL